MARAGDKEARGRKGGGYKVGVKVGVESTGSKNGAKLTLEPTLRKERERRRKDRKDRKGSDRSRTAVARVEVEGLSPAAQASRPGEEVVAIRSGSRIMVLSERGALGFVPAWKAEEVCGHLRNGTLGRIVDARREFENPLELSVEFPRSVDLAEESPGDRSSRVSGRPQEPTGPAELQREVGR